MPIRPNVHDKTVSANLVLVRSALGLTQDQVAQAIGVTTQQYNKYERAKNRLTVGRIYELAVFFKVPVDNFFVPVQDQDYFLHSACYTRSLLNLSRNVQSLSEEQQRIFLELSRTLSGRSEEREHDQDPVPLPAAFKLKRKPVLRRTLRKW